jgi:cell division protein FtsQ
MAKRQIIKNILLFTIWSAIGAGTVVLLVAAIQQKDAKKCTDVDINIKGVSNNFFVDKNDILNTIISISEGRPVGKPIGSFDLKAMETALQKNVWVKNAQLFFDNNERLQVNVLEREPVARVFTTTGTTFYIDSSVAMLPLNEKFSARLPVFTNFPSDKKVLLKADSSLLKDILTISTAIREDSFYMAMIDQVDITAQRTFEMVPKFGNSIIVFGDAKNAAEKLNKLQLFYKEVIVKTGWNKYSEINVCYNNQVVAKRKGAEEVKADSLRTLQLMQVIAENAERLAGDSSLTIKPENEHNPADNSIILQSIERDDHNNTANTIEEPLPQGDTTSEKTLLPGPVKPRISKPGTATVNKPVIVVKIPAGVKPPGTHEKPIVKPTPGDRKKPKLLMPKPVSKKAVETKQFNEYEQ